MTTAVSLTGIAEAAFYARVSAFAALETALGGAGRIKYGWAATILAEPAASDFPLLTYFTVAPAPDYEDIGSVRIQADIWAWTPEELDAIEAQLIGRIYRSRWTNAGRRFSCWDMGGRSWPYDPSDPPQRRMVEFRVEVNG